MRLIGEQFWETPWYGSRQMARRLRREGSHVGRKRVVRLIRKRGLTPVCCVGWRSRSLAASGAPISKKAVKLSNQWGTPLFFREGAGTRFSLIIEYNVL